MHTPQLIECFQPCRHSRTAEKAGYAAESVLAKESDQAEGGATAVGEGLGGELQAVVPEPVVGRTGEHSEGGPVDFQTAGIYSVYSCFDAWLSFLAHAARLDIAIIYTDKARKAHSAASEVCPGGAGQGLSRKGGRPWNDACRFNHVCVVAPFALLIKLHFGFCDITLYNMYIHMIVHIYMYS